MALEVGHVVGARPGPGCLSGLTLVLALDPKMPRDQGEQKQIPFSNRACLKQDLGRGGLARHSKPRPVRPTWQ